MFKKWQGWLNSFAQHREIQYQVAKLIKTRIKIVGLFIIVECIFHIASSKVLLCRKLHWMKKKGYWLPINQLHYLWKIRYFILWVKSLHDTGLHRVHFCKDGKFSLIEGTVAWSSGTDHHTKLLSRCGKRRLLSLWLEAWPGRLGVVSDFEPWETRQDQA